jgi:hypothetical protein
MIAQRSPRRTIRSSLLWIVRGRRTSWHPLTQDTSLPLRSGLAKVEAALDDAARRLDRSILSIFLARLWTWLALLGWALEALDEAQLLGEHGLLLLVLGLALGGVQGPGLLVGVVVAGRCGAHLAAVDLDDALAPRGSSRRGRGRSSRRAGRVPQPASSQRMLSMSR